MSEDKKNPDGEWRELFRDSVTTADGVADALGLDAEKIAPVFDDFSVRISSYYMGLIEKEGDPIWKQAVPDPEEIGSDGVEDPLGEDEDSPVKSITHRYPDRVLFYVNSVCSMYCRFCTRKRKVSDADSINRQGIEEGLDYIREHSEIRDVIVSGGDPLMMSDKRIDEVLTALRAIEHVEIIRIGTRVPVTLPQRITESLCEVLKKHHPFYINTHFNHPREITPESTKACAMLADAGIPLGNQSVLLKGVNDSPEVMKELVQKLLSIRVKPYYIYQADQVFGTDHFRTSVETGWNIIEALRGHTSGLAVPHYVIDAPGGGGKIATSRNPVVMHQNGDIVLKNYEGKLFRYPSDAPGERVKPAAGRPAEPPAQQEEAI